MRALPRGKLSGDEQERPREEHLSLERERPEMLQRRGGRGIKRVVVNARDRQPNILDVGRGRNRVRDHGLPRGFGQDQEAAEEGAKDCDGCGRHEPREGPQPVPHRPEGLACIETPRKRGTEEKRGDEKKDVDPTGNTPEPHVVDHDHEHADGAKALDFGAEVRGLGCVRGSVLGASARGGGVRRLLGNLGFLVPHERLAGVFGGAPRGDVFAFALFGFLHPREVVEGLERGFLRVLNEILEREAGGVFAR